MFKCGWPRFAPPVEIGVGWLQSSEGLVLQFERLVAMHDCVPSAIPLPIGVVRSRDVGFVGYVVERVHGQTLGQLVDDGFLDEARRCLGRVEAVVARLQARCCPMASYDGEHHRCR
jgi:hypothetical protein